ncbi:MAG: hypothetical protein CMO01_11940 [Thalassobius sp.]|nr:hypothetical protein [Thalassovita sp.]|tara:strand:+ start:48674 stop:49585 length:912 start_codon:yes stop_codon:yes gene_type:complete
MTEATEIPVIGNDKVTTVSIPVKATRRIVLCNECEDGSYRRSTKRKVRVGNSPTDPVLIPHECKECGHEAFIEAAWVELVWENANLDASRNMLRDQYGHAGVISLIWARTHNFGIGHKGDLPWGRDFPTDLKWFKAVTTHNPKALLVVGRETYEGLPPLPDRQFAVLTTSVSEKTPIDGTEGNGYYYPDIPTLLEEHSETDLIVIGGGHCYKQWFAMADVVYETIIYGSYPVDVFCPMLNADNFTNLDSHCVKNCDDTGKPVVFNIWLSNRAKGSIEEHIIRDRWNFKVEEKLFPEKFTTISE